MINEVDLVGRAAPAQADESTAIFDERESNVRSYCRAFPAVFTSAQGSLLYDEQGRSFIDFFAAAGSLNYGHNHPVMKEVLIEYLTKDGIAQGLDFHTDAKRAFLTEFTSTILEPRGLSHRVQFVGPTGTNAVEAGLKIARKATGRQGVIAFMGAYHGHSLGSLAATSNRAHRAGAGVALGGVTFVPFPSTSGPTAGLDTLAYIRHLLTSTHSGIDLPAAIIVEAVQAEGGVNVAPFGWLAGLRKICDEFGIVLMLDEVQTGCGRTGTFFAFENYGIVPDIIAVSKSISGYGLPMALTLIAPELDVWEPGEHTGTFRGNQLAFVTAKCALQIYRDADFQRDLAENAALVRELIDREIAPIDTRIETRGLGMMWGIDLGAIDPSGATTAAVARQCFDNGLVIETAGSNSTVLKFLAPLNIERFQLRRGMSILADSLRSCLA
jgi:diaminobutyrate-2-oxoglutarate transaminase